MKPEAIIGIDLAGIPKNPTGWAILRDITVRAQILHTDGQILQKVTKSRPLIIAIDAPFSLPKTGLLRKTDKEMIRRGYRVFPPTLQSMRKLTLRAEKMNKLIVEKGYKTIEAHPTSTRKALSMPSKDWKEIQAMLMSVGLKGDVKTRSLTNHEIDAVIAALTAYLHVRNETESIGDTEEGYIIVPKKRDWRTLKV